MQQTRCPIIFANNIKLTVLIITLIAFTADSTGGASFNCPPNTDEELGAMLGAAYNARYMAIKRPVEFGGGAALAPTLLDVEPKNRAPFAERLSSNDQTVLSSDFKVEPNFRRIDETDPNYSLNPKPFIGREKRSSGAENEHFIQELRNNHDSNRETSSNGFNASGNQISDVTKETLLRRAETMNLTLVEQFPNSQIRSKRQSNDMHRNSGQPSQTVLPWTCKQEVRWIDLGPDYFPRYLRSMKCTSDRCFYGHYFCRPKAFTVKVLRRLADKCIEIAPKVSHSMTTSRPPILRVSQQAPIFREPWVFEEVAVTFCCECTLF